MDKAKGGSFEGGRWMGGARGYGGLKWRQLYLNNKKMKKWGKINTKDYKKIL